MPVRARARACVCVCAYASQTFDSERPSNHVEEQTDKLQTKYAEEYKERREELRQAASAEYKEAIRAQQSGSLWNSLLKMVTG